MTHRGERFPGGLRPAAAVILIGVFLVVLGTVPHLLSRFAEGEEAPALLPEGATRLFTAIGSDTAVSLPRDAEPPSVDRPVADPRAPPHSPASL
jgi:hypothetical protein